MIKLIGSIYLIVISTLLNAQFHIGSDINGEAEGDHFGNAVSMPDANTLAISAPYNDGNGDNSGHARVYYWNGTEWIQKGQDLDGEATNDGAGWSVSMPDANTVGFGAPGNSEAAGQVRIYKWYGTNWHLEGIDIDGESSWDRSGNSVSMPDAYTVAIWAYNNDGTGTNSGHVRVYSFIASTESQLPLPKVKIHPNPTTGVVNIDLGELKNVTIQLSTIQGTVISREEATQSSHMIDIKATKGLFIIKVSYGRNARHFKVVKM